MPNIEVLAYCPSIPMNEFKVFCVSGAPKPAGSPTEMPGVFKWLYSRRVLAAHFFTSDPKDKLQVFGVTVTQPDTEPEPVPWTKQIAGFDKRVDGEIGTFSPVPPWQTNVTKNQILDDLFEEGRQHAERIFEALESNKSELTFTAADFKAALNGKSTPGLAKLLAEVENKLNFSPFAKLELAKTTESLR